jgi:hypothetical protein
MTAARLLLALSLTIAATSANAVVTYTATAGTTSLQAVDNTIKFDLPLTQTYGLASYDTHALIAAGDSSYAAQPPGTDPGFFSVGTTHGQLSSSSVNFAGAGVSYFGFYLGSPDSYNIVTLYSGQTEVLSLNGTQMATAFTSSLASDGNQSVGFYMNFFAGNLAPITKVTFSSNQDAFESDNHSYIAAVPEADTYAMLLAGLALTGVMARRRQRQA